MRLDLLLVLSFCGLVVATNPPDFTKCINDLNSGVFGWEVPGTVDINGNPVANASDAIGLAYDSCRNICGDGRESLTWIAFSQQFSAWFLPWLPLISQLPYGTKDPLSNFVAVLLMVGSPALAAYSLALAIISNRWMVKRFSRSTLPHSFLAAQTLSNLQQVHIRLPKEDHVLPSLIALRENVGWWQTLSNGLDYPVPKWTIAATMSVLYVVLADAFSWASTLGGNLHVTTTAESIGSLWLSLLPIVICYLQLAPKSDMDRISRALEQANKRFYVAADKNELEHGHASLAITIEKVPRDSIHEDATCSAPVFFYARFFEWMRLARVMTDGFDAASQNSIDRSKEGINYRGRSEIIDYCTLRDDHYSRYSYDVFSIMFRSAFLAIFLQWGTTGAAVLAMYLTPTKGFSCRSISYLVYGLVGTLAWLCCLISSILSHSYVTAKTRTKTTAFAGGISIAFRHLAKALAAANTVWLFLQSLLQFSNIYDTCFCNGSVLSLGKRAYAVLRLTHDVSTAVKIAWAGGLILSTLTAILFVFALNLLLKSPDSRSGALQLMEMHAHCDICQLNSPHRSPSTIYNKSSTQPDYIVDNGSR